MKLFRKLLCRVGAHGPEWGGYGLNNTSPSNTIVGPGHRRCNYCRAEWVAYEAASNRPYRVIAWERINPAKHTP